MIKPTAPLPAPLTPQTDPAPAPTLIKPASPPPAPPTVQSDSSLTPILPHTPEPPASTKPAPPCEEVEIALLRAELAGTVLPGPCHLTKPRTRIGRAPSNDIVIPQSNVSSLHATINYQEGVFYLEDQRSANGTRLNGGQRLEPNKPMLLKNGDHIKIATCELLFLKDDGTILDSDSWGDPVADPTSNRDLPSRALTPEPSGRPGVSLKQSRCPNHPAWQAKDRCAVCQQNFCPQCVVQTEDGRIICLECDEQGAASPSSQGEMS